MSSQVSPERYALPRYCFVPLVVIFVLAGVLLTDSALAQPTVQKVVEAGSKEQQVTEKSEAKPAKSLGPPDEFKRGVPRSSFMGFLEATREGDYDRAAMYLDFRNLPREVKRIEGPELARQLKIVLDRALWVDPELLSNDPKGQADDGLPSYRDHIGYIKTPEKTVDVLLQRIPRKDGMFIWKFSNRTVAQIPLLYKHYGYGHFEETLSEIFPDVTFLGWQIWQWVAFLIVTAVTYLAARVSTWVIGKLVRRRDAEMSHHVALFVTGPLRIVLWLLLARAAMSLIGPSVAIRTLLQAGTFLTIAVTWAAMRVVGLIIDGLAERMRREDQQAATVLLRPMSTAAKIMIGIVAVLIWFENIGFSASTLLAGLGVGGLALALATQDTLKNLVGTIMIFLDKPYQVGQRIVVKGHDGVVEEIGLRSTRLRLLTGHQTTIPNDEMARADIENIGRRPHIRRLANIALPYDTPLEKVGKAVEIIKRILYNHEGMDPEFPSRVYFNEFNRDSINIIMLYWYHPSDYWAFLTLNQRVNTQIMQEFEKEGIKFALPSTATFFTQGDQKPLLMDITKHS